MTIANINGTHAPERRADISTRPPRIIGRTRGRRHGPITRLMSPGDLGELLKPFVFLDLFDAWHGGGPGDTGHTRGFQLWLALPPDEELGPVENIYLSPDGVARAGPARILIGHYGDALSSLKAAGSLNYLAVRLRAGESWRYQPDIHHTVSWLALSAGQLLVPDTVEAGELAIFEPSSNAIKVYAKADADFVLGSAAAHTHDLVLGKYSVHTSAATLRAGERRINEIQQRLQNEGRL